MTYAADTSISVARSKADIESLITRRGASSFGTLTEPGRSVILFKLNDRAVRFSVPLPDAEDPRFQPIRKRYGKTDEQRRYENWEQACRSLWRALFLVVKAKLEAVESGITTFEDEFMAHLVIGPKGQTVSETILPQLNEMRDTGKHLPLMLTGR